MSVHNFDVLKAMVDGNKDIRWCPDIIRITKVKVGSKVTVGVPGDVVAAIADGNLHGGLLLFDKAQFDETKRELEGR